MARNEEGKVFFDEDEQKEVDRIVGERLSRAKAEKPADYEDLLEVSKELEDFGYSGTPAEKKAAIKAYKAQLAAQQEVEELQKQAKEQGTTPEVMKAIAEANKAAKEANEKVAAMEAKEKELKEKKDSEDQQNKAYQAARQDLLDKHGVDADELEKNPKFMRFIRGKTNINLTEEYEAFEDLMGDTEVEVIKKLSSKELRSTSGGKGSNNSGGGANLTAEQKKMVDDWNIKNPKMKMSYKEYADKL